MRLYRRSFIALASLLLVVACASDGVGPGEKAPAEITSLPRTLTSDERALIAASNGFGIGLLRAVTAKTNPDSNVFLSPLSASMALGMTMNGMAGTALDETRATLGFGTTPLASIDASYQSLIALLRGLDTKVDFRLANAVWYTSTFSVEPTFVSTVQQFFGARVSALDFASASAVPTMNAWVSEATNGKIAKIMDPPIDPAMVMFLMNAIYFKGDWTQQFDKSKTKDDRFTTSAGSTMPVSMMEAQLPARYGDAADAEIIDLPYGGKAFSMTILLPKANVPVRTLVASLTPAGWDTRIASLSAAKVKLQMPKFRIEWGDNLNAALQAMGMQLPFVGGDWSPMSKAYADMLYIDHVVQKTYVDVNEEGTEAAGVTSIGIGVTSAPVERNVTLRIDRPFVVAIREKLTGTLLFAGVIERP